MPDDFELMLRFKAGAGIASLVSWIKEYHQEVVAELSALKAQVVNYNCEIERLTNELIAERAK